MQYLLDANVFIQAKNSYYSMDFCPAFWEWLDHEKAAGRIVSISEVATELKGQEDELSDWIKARNDSAFFLPIDDPQTQQAYTRIANYVVQNYEETAFNLFLNVADPWLVAKAMTTGATLVTHEKLVGPGSKKLKIPNICKQFGVQYINTFTLLRELEARFILKPAA